jgi:hypothetical protein
MCSIRKDADLDSNKCGFYSYCENGSLKDYATTGVVALQKEVFPTGDVG